MVQIGYDIDVVLSTPRQLVLLVLYSLCEQNIPRLLLLSVLPPSWFAWIVCPSSLSWGRREEGSAGFYLFSRHIESDTTSKLTLQDINTTPIEPKTERAQQRTEQRSSAEKIPALSALTLNSSTHRITPHHVSPEVKTEESKGRYDVSQRRMAKTTQRQG